MFDNIKLVTKIIFDSFVKLLSIFHKFLNGSDKFSLCQL